MTEFSKESIDGWLASKNTTTWVNWDISDPKERLDAAAWLHDQLTQYDRYRNENNRWYMP